MSSLLRLKLKNPRAFRRFLRNHSASPVRPVVQHAQTPAQAVAQAENFVKRAFDDAKSKLRGRLNAAARHAENEARRLMRQGLRKEHAIQIAARQAAHKEMRSGMGCPPRN